MRKWFVEEWRGGKWVPAVYNRDPSVPSKRNKLIPEFRNPPVQLEEGENTRPEYLLKKYGGDK